MAGERILPGLGLTAYWDLGDNTWKAGMDANLSLLSVLVQPVVLSVEATEPGSPTDGDVYISTGTWGGSAAQDIVARDNGAWVSITPVEGWKAYNQATDEDLLFDGAAWNAVGSGGSYFLGVFASEAALTTAHASAMPGNYAHVDTGAASDVTLYIWDDSDSVWVESGSAAAASGGLTLVTDGAADRVLSDADLGGDRVIERDNASAQTVTVNTGLTGTEPVTIINTGGGLLTFGGTATILSADGNLKVDTQYASATLIPAGSDTFYLVGALVA